MRHFLKLICIIAALNAFGDENLRQNEELLELYKKFYEYKISRNLQGLDEILAPEFMLTHMTGRIQSKDEWLSEVKNEIMRYFGYEIENLELKFDGENPYIIGRSKTDARVYGYRRVWNLELKIPLVKVGDVYKIKKAVARSY